MPRTHQEIQQSANALITQIGQNRAQYLAREKQLQAQLDSLEAEIVARKAEDEKLSPAAMLARIEALETKEKS